MPRTRRRLRGPLALAAAATVASLVAADNTACSGTGMDWYINMVGETPCTTYQRLRQICNSQFTVGTMDVNTPPDFCTDQVSACCCNTVAFALSMLCLNCQQNIGNTTGYDAGVGAYQIYLNGSLTSTRSCSNPTTQALPKDIQTAVCNEKIKINNDIYNSYWSDGEWFYVYTRDSIIKDNIVANNNSFTKCASTTINSTSSASVSSSGSASPASSSSSATTSAAASNKSSSLASGAIAGIAVGAVVGLVALAGVGWLVRKRRGTDGTRAGLLDEPLGGGSSGRGSGGGGSGGGIAMGAVDDSLIARGYSYTSPSSEIAGGSGGHPASSDYFNGSAVGTSEASGPGFAGLGAASAYNAQHAHVNANANAYDSQSGATSPRRGFHAAQASTSSLTTSHPYGGVAPSVSGSSSSGGGAAPAGATVMGAAGAERREAGPLPRKHRGGPGALPPGAAPATTTTGQRAPSEEPFLEAEEREPWQMVGERHTDAGPIDGASLGRSASGRLPPAYGELIG